MVGFRGEETDKCWREVTLSVRWVVVGLDLVKGADSYPNPPPLNLTSPSSSRVLRKTDLSTLNKRKKDTTAPAAHLGCGLK